jgi:hypothetical protein
VNIFTKRNALVGYLVLTTLQKKKWARRRKTMKFVALVALGVVSMGILAALVAVALRRQQRESDAGTLGEEGLEESSADDYFGAGLPEPGFAA